MDAVATTTMPNLSEFEAAPRDAAVIPEFQQAANKSYKYGYWRKPDGYLAIAPTWPIEAANQYDQGWRKLDRRYGEFLLTNTTEDGSTWRTGPDPWRQLLARGGAKEFTVQEIIEHGWHRQGNAPYGVTFPQLVGAELPVDHVCTKCSPKRHFNSVDDLSKHESVMHRDTSQNEQLARNMTKANAPTSDALLVALGSLTDAQREQQVFNSQILERMERNDGMIVALLQRLTGQDTPASSPPVKEKKAS